MFTNKKIVQISIPEAYQYQYMNMILRLDGADRSPNQLPFIIHSIGRVYHNVNWMVLVQIEVPLLFNCERLRKAHCSHLVLEGKPQGPIECTSEEFCDLVF